MRMLVVEDEPKLSGLLGRALRERGHAVDLCATGEDAIECATTTSYAVIVLDVMLPGIDGFGTCAALREDGVYTPVLMLTARDAVRDRVRGLDAGADDYLTKPFALVELFARLRALARRRGGVRATTLTVGDLRLDQAAHRVWRAECEINLSPKEFALLDALMSRPGEVLTRLDLLDHGWDMACDNRSNVLTVYMRYLRNKIDRPFGRTSLETVYGRGYRLRDEVTG